MTDRQTDIRTDGFAIAYSALSMLSRAKNGRISDLLELRYNPSIVNVVDVVVVRKGGNVMVSIPEDDDDGDVARRNDAADGMWSPISCL